MKLKTLWRDIRFLKVVAQLAFVVVLVLVALYFYRNVTTNLARQGLTVGYGFMRNPASFGIGETHIPYEPSDTYARALLVGLVNTLVVSALGVVLTTVVGVLAGVGRLSTNWLVSRIAAAYVGVIRNTPLLLQLMFWYFAVFIQLPPVSEAIEFPGPAFLTQRGV
jgi:general L-amino acid transport system permease protein